MNKKGEKKLNKRECKKKTIIKMKENKIFFTMIMMIVVEPLLDS